VVWKSGNDVAGYSTPVEMKVGGVEMFALLTGENVVGVAAKDGKLLWSYRWPNRSKINVPQVIVDGDKVFVTTGYGIGCTLLQIVPAGGGFQAKEVWPMNKSMECRYGNPVLLDGYVYGFDEKQLTCVELKTGKQMWTKDGYGYGALSYADGLFYIMGEKGNLALAKLTPEKCEIVSEVKILPEKESLWATPTVADGKLFIRNSQKILCLDIKAK
jgi:outer membrane protein assembly factor BamB